jgi:sugar/nucleoside kinase (ribokinase family)
MCNNIDVLCVGQLSVDILVKPVEKVDFHLDTQRVDTLEITNGGDCLNVAIGLSRLGNRVRFIGKIGEDHFGDFLTKVIDKTGIDYKGLRISTEAPTCSVLVLINSSGERTFFYQGGANDHFSLNDIDMSLVDNVKLVHVGGTYLLPHFDGSGAASLFTKAQSIGKITAMDVTWDVTGRWLETIETCLPHLDFFLPSLREAEKITGKCTPQEMASFLQGRGVKNVIIKLGESGCYVQPAGTEERGFFVKPHKTRVVDTTGAGDAFVAGFLSAYLRKWDLWKCAQFGCATAAFNIQSVGATEGSPTFEEAMQLMNRGG